MKKYTTLPNIDYTALIAETTAYLNANFDVEDAEHIVTPFHLLGEPSALTDIPSMLTLFSNLEITPGTIAHYAVHKNALLNHTLGVNALLVPIMDCENTVIKLFDTLPGTIKDDVTQSYAKSSCVLTETVALTTGILLNKDQVFTIQTPLAQEALADILVIYFIEDTDSLLA